MAVFEDRQFAWSVAKTLDNVKTMSEMMDCAAFLKDFSCMLVFICLQKNAGP